MFCPQCGSEAVDDARFCVTCGRDLSIAPAPAPAAPAPEPAPVQPPAPAYAGSAPTAEFASVTAAAAGQAPVWTGWPKAPVFARLIASIIDAIIMEPLVIPALFWILADSARGVAPVGGILLMVVGSIWMFVYAYIKDGLKGASLGKRIVGLMVVSLRDNRPGGIGASILRAFILNLISPIEAVMVLLDKRGQRIGDKAAKTQVVRMADYEAALPGWTPPGKGLAVALLVAALLMGGVGGVVSGLVWAGAVATGIGSPTAVPAAPATGAEPGPVLPDTTTSDSRVDAAARTVSDYYAAINAADMDAIKALVVPDLKTQLDPGAFEGWSTTSFEFTRGWIDAGEASVIGRESVQAYGAGDGGGVKFTLQEVRGSWLIKSWQPVDAAQVEGSDTSGSSSGIPGTLSDAAARDLIKRLLKARQTGAANIIRTLATPKFLKAHGDVWLDGIDNSEYFTAFKVVSVKVTGASAKVVVDETWPDGRSRTTYGLVESGGAVLVDSWVVR